MNQKSNILLLSLLTIFFSWQTAKAQSLATDDSQQDCPCIVADATRFCGECHPITCTVSYGDVL